MTELSLATLRARALLLRATREFFWERGYVEIDTPVLSPALIPEHTIEVFTTDYFPHTGAARRLFLVPSPEVWMKRLLALGTGNIFQICHCFRNAEPPTGVHHPEFTMLEWYAVNADYRDNMTLQEEYGERLRLVLGVADTVNVRGRPVNLRPPYRRLSLQEVYFDLADVDLASCREWGALREAAVRTGVEAAPSDDWESLFHKIFLEKVEPRLPWDRPLFLTDYPAALPTLARTGADGLTAERWELYLGGLEIANCYTEERDPARLAGFFEREEAARRTARVGVPADRELERIMAAGLPPSSGNALGLDRLLMVLIGEELINEVLPFAWYTQR